MDNRIKIDFELHYFLNKPNLHIMDAHIHNECERNMLLSIKCLNKYFDSELIIEVIPIEEGGIRNKYIFSFGCSACSMLFGAWANSFFRPAIHKTEEQKNRIEILEKIKANDYTLEEVEYILQDDNDFKKVRSLFYKDISNEPSVTKIETVLLDKDKNQIIDRTIIERAQFSTNIIDDRRAQSSVEVAASVLIVAPVLAPRRRLPWRGIYRGMPIEFKIEDKEFLNQVYNQEIKFGAGTHINCRLQIITKTKMSSIDEDVKTYIVKEVKEWIDENHYQTDTKRYKRIKENKRQLTLFLKD